MCIFQIMILKFIFGNNRIEAQTTSMAQPQNQQQITFSKSELIRIERPPNMPQQQVTNSFSTTPVLTQLIAYLLFFGQISVYFVCIDPIYRNIPILIIYIVLTILAIGSTVSASCIDPTDQIMYIHKWQQYFQNDQNKSKNDQNLKRILESVNKYRAFKDYQQMRNLGNQIDNQVQIRQLTNLSYCIHCSSYCSLKAKHCRRCQRCVRKFDHHCIWINNCVGQRNYKPFIIMIVSVFLHMTIFIVQGVIMSVQVPNQNQGILQRKIVCWVYMSIIAIFAFLLLNLVLLHIYLLCTDQTTYDFLVSIKKAQQKKLREAQQPQRNLQIQMQMQHQILQNQREQSNVKLTENNVFDQKKSIKISRKEITSSQFPLQFSSQAIYIQPSNSLPETKVKGSKLIKIGRQLIKQRIKTQNYSETGSVKQIPCQKNQSYQLKQEKKQEQIRQFPIFFTINKSFKIILGENQVAQSICNRPATTRTILTKKTSNGNNNISF